MIERIEYSKDFNCGIMLCKSKFRFVYFNKLNLKKEKIIFYKRQRIAGHTDYGYNFFMN